LDRAAFGLVDDTVRVDYLADVDRADQARDADLAAGLDLGDHRAPGAEVLVLGVADAMATALALLPRAPAGALRRRLDDGAAARIRQLAQEECHRILAAARSDL